MSRSLFGNRSLLGPEDGEPVPEARRKPTAQEPTIEAHGLRRRFGPTHALAGLDLVAPSGRVVALLGPNGAGKTTFVRTVATLVKPDSGTLRVAGVDALRHPARVRRLIGLAGQAAAVEEAMTGRENLEMVGHLFGLKRGAARAAATEVLRHLELEDVADRLVRTYSGGLRRRLDLGASLVGRPRLLLLDEPTTGLDPRSRMQLWEAIRTLVANGTDVLLTTQYLEEADQLASDIVIIDHGTVIAAGTPGELKAKAGRDVIEMRPVDRTAAPRLVEAFARLGHAARFEPVSGRLSVPVADGTAQLLDLVRAAEQLEVAIEDLALRRPTLDEVFLTLTGKPIAADEAA